MWKVEVKAVLVGPSIVVKDKFMVDLPAIKHVKRFSSRTLSDLGPVPSRSLEITLDRILKITMHILPLVSSSKMIFGV